MIQMPSNVVTNLAGGGGVGEQAGDEVTQL